MNAELDQILARPASSPMRFGGVLLLAFASHLGLGVAAASVRRPEVPSHLRETEMQALPDEPPPPPPPPPVPEVPEPEKAKAATPAPVPNARAAKAPPPAAAAKVMTAPDDAPLDLTGGMVVGSAETFGGGAVAATSTGPRVGSWGGAPTSSGRAVSSAPPNGPDQSHPPRLAEGVSWNCPFPVEADEKGIDNAVVALSIEVAANGDIVNVTVDRESGNGFGRVAASCARSKRFSPAADRAGTATAGRSRVNVRFHR